MLIITLIRKEKLFFSIIFFFPSVPMVAKGTNAACRLDQWSGTTVEDKHTVLSPHDSVNC